MAFGKTIGAEALDLLEAKLGEFARVSPREHAIDHLGEEGVDRAHALEGRHGPPQLVSLAGREACRDNGDLHRLFLKQRHAQCAPQHLLQFF